MKFDMDNEGGSYPLINAYDDEGNYLGYLQLELLEYDSDWMNKLKEECKQDLEYVDRLIRSDDNVLSVWYHNPVIVEVVEEYQRKGIATALFQAFLDISHDDTEPIIIISDECFGGITRAPEIYEKLQKSLIGKGQVISSVTK